MGLLASLFKTVNGGVAVPPPRPSYFWRTVPCRCRGCRGRIRIVRIVNTTTGLRAYYGACTRRGCPSIVAIDRDGVKHIATTSATKVMLAA